MGIIIKNIIISHCNYIIIIGIQSDPHKEATFAATASQDR